MPVVLIEHRQAPEDLGRVVHPSLLVRHREELLQRVGLGRIEAGRGLERRLDRGLVLSRVRDVGPNHLHCVPVDVRGAHRVELRLRRRQVLVASARRAER